MNGMNGISDGTEYKLTVLIDKKDLPKLEGSVVALSKAENTNVGIINGTISSQKKNLDVTWVVSEAWATIVVTWKREFKIYASNTKIEKGAKIEVSSDEDAIPACNLYKFEHNKFDVEQKEEFDPDDTSYYYENLQEDGITMGLAQTVTIGDKVVTSPINAVKSLKFSEGTFTPVEKIKIFISNDASDGKVIAHSTTQATYVDFTKKREKTVKFNTKLNIFEEIEN